MIKPDVQKMDDMIFRSRNVKAELAYNGINIRHRKSITNMDLRFYAWLFRAALRRIEELEPKTATITVGRSKGGVTLWHECGKCGEPVDAKDNYCPGCGAKLIKAEVEE